MAPSPTLGIKMFVAVSDTTSEMGCTSFVPGSHLVWEEPRSIWPAGLSFTVRARHLRVAY